MKTFLALFALAALNIAQGAQNAYNDPYAPSYPPTKLVHCYRKQDGTDFFMTSDETEAKSIGMGLGTQKYGLIYLGAQFRVGEVQFDVNWTPLYRYVNNGVHFYTIDPNEIGATNAAGSVGKYGYSYEGIVGYISKVALPKTAALHRFYFPNKSQSHQYVLKNNPDYRMNRADPAIVYENITGYVIVKHAFDRNC